MSGGLEAHGVPPPGAQHAAQLPPVSILFAAFLGYNPIQHLVGAHVLAALRAADQRGADRPRLLPAPDLGPVPRRARAAFAFAIVACLVAAAASLMRGGRYRHAEERRRAGAPATAPNRGLRAERLRMTARTTATVLYDRECGFCRWCVGWVLRLDRRRRLRTVALQADLAIELLPGLSPEQRIGSWHLVGAEGGVLSGGAALAPLASLLWPGSGRRLGRLISRFADPGYQLVADHRGPLGRLVSVDAVARADHLIAERSRRQT